jgi:hypothetical protein
LLCDEAKISDEGYFVQSMLLSKALRMQQDIEDKKNEIIIEGLEKNQRSRSFSREERLSPSDNGGFIGRSPSQSC